MDAKARELNETYKIVERSKGLASDASAAVSGALAKAQQHEAVAKASTSLRGFLSKAGEKAGEALTVAKAKASELAANAAGAPPAAAPAPQQ